MNTMIKKYKSALNSLWPEIILMSALFLIWIFLYKIPLSTDVTYQLWVARRLLNGSKLYVDVIESNPPLWFWMAIPVEYIAQKININSSYVLVTCVFVYAGIGLFLISCMSRRTPHNNRLILLLSTAFIMLLVSLSDIGQREHLALIGSLPYIVLLSKRIDMEEVSFSIAIAVGFFASFGFALKHYFALVPIFVEIFLIFKLKNRWKILRSELFVLFSFAVIYVFCIVLYTNEYLYIIIPILNDVYSSYRLPFYYHVVNLNFFYWVLCFLILFNYKDSFKSALVSASFVASVGFVCGYFLQYKGWTYHALPATGMFCFCVVSFLNERYSFSLKFLQRFTLCCSALYPFAVSFLINGIYIGPSPEVMAVVMRKAPQGSPVFALTINPNIIWPDVINKGYRWPSRHFSFWLLASADVDLYAKRESPATKQKFVDDVVNQITDDLYCNPPSVIVVDKFSKGDKMLKFMENSEKFNRMFSNYKLYEIVEGKIDFYFKSETFEPEKPKTCIRL